MLLVAVDVYSFLMAQGQTRLILRASAASDVGQRSGQEDAWLINEKLGLFIVADGIGGHDKGEVASRFTVENLDRRIESVEQDNAPTEDERLELRQPDDEELLELAVLSINKQLYMENEKELARLEAVTRLNSTGEALPAAVSRKKRMGTTLVSLLIRGKRAYITHIGDSRAYRIGGDTIQLLTQDHSWAGEQARSGDISHSGAASHTKRHVLTRSVGCASNVKADIDVLTLYPPERFLLCSDGLSNVVSEDEMLTLARHPDIDTVTSELVDLAKANGGRDNITAVLVDVAAAPADGATS